MAVRQSTRLWPNPEGNFAAKLEIEIGQRLSTNDQIRPHLSRGSSFFDISLEASRPLIKAPHPQLLAPRPANRTRYGRTSAAHRPRGWKGNGKGCSRFAAVHNIHQVGLLLPRGWRCLLRCPIENGIRSRPQRQVRCDEYLAAGFSTISESI